MGIKEWLDNNGMALLMVTFILFIFAIGIIWAIYQYNICMEVIGNMWYCIQHAT